MIRSSSSQEMIKAKQGTVLSRNEDRVIVKGINIRKKHVKRKKDAPSVANS